EVLLIGRHVFRPHAGGLALPGFAAVGRAPDAAAGNAHLDAAAVARVYADRMDAGQFTAATGPLLAHGIVPQRPHQVPGVAVVGRAEQAAGQGAAPQPPGLRRAAGLQRPDEFVVPGDGLLRPRVDVRRGAFRRGRVLRGGALRPGGAAVPRAVQ